MNEEVYPHQMEDRDHETTSSKGYTLPINLNESGSSPVPSNTTLTGNDHVLSNNNYMPGSSPDKTRKVGSPISSIDGTKDDRTTSSSKRNSFSGDSSCTTDIGKPEVDRAMEMAAMIHGLTGDSTDGSLIFPQHLQYGTAYGGTANGGYMSSLHQYLMLQHLAAMEAASISSNTVPGRGIPNLDSSGLQNSSNHCGILNSSGDLSNLRLGNIIANMSYAEQIYHQTFLSSLLAQVNGGFHPPSESPQALLQQLLAEHQREMIKNSSQVASINDSTSSQTPHSYSHTKNHTVSVDSFISKEPHHTQEIVNSQVACSNIVKSQQEPDIRHQKTTKNADYDSSKCENDLVCENYRLHSGISDDICSASDVRHIDFDDRKGEGGYQENGSNNDNCDNETSDGHAIVVVLPLDDEVDGGNGRCSAPSTGNSNKSHNRRKQARPMKLSEVSKTDENQELAEDVLPSKQSCLTDKSNPSPPVLPQTPMMLGGIQQASLQPLLPHPILSQQMPQSVIHSKLPSAYMHAVQSFSGALAPDCITPFTALNNLHSESSTASPGSTSPNKESPPNMLEGKVRTYSCPICDKLFVADDSLKRHMKIHSGQGLHSCTICHKGFQHQGGLKAHMLIHSGEKPYECDVCRRGFRQAGQLKRHKLIHTGEKPFACEYCTKTFRTSYEIKIHHRTHTGEKPFICNVCGASFTQSCNWKKHLLIHSTKKRSDDEYHSSLHHERESLCKQDQHINATQVPV